MNILEELWYGNIEPGVYPKFCVNSNKWGKIGSK